MSSCRKFSRFFLLSGSVLIAACGGGGGGGSSSSSSTESAEVLVGVLTDSPVANVSYETDSQSGTTNSDGEFNYVEGETITFSIGDLVFDGVDASELLSPLDLAGTDDIDDQEVINITRLLQTLDSDGDSDNGITIDSDAIDSAVDLDFDVSPIDFEQNADVRNLVQNSGGVLTELVSQEDALVHLVDTLSEEGLVDDQDSDADGVPDIIDFAPNDPTETFDSDGDGIGDVADPDDDNDGTLDVDEGDQNGGDDEEANESPTVEAGNNQTVTEGNLVSLDATITDDDQSLTIVWSQLSGPSVTLSANNIEDPTFTPSGIYTDQTVVLQLSVDDGVNEAVTDQVSISVEESKTDDWIINTENEISANMTDDGDDVEVNIQSVSVGESLVTVNTNSTPNYSITVDQEILAIYDEKFDISIADEMLRPDDGDVISFGDDIGFSSECGTSGGDGWWPTGSSTSGGGSCSQVQARSKSFPIAPTADQTCELGTGAIGMWVNGAEIYSWSDGTSYNDAGVWNQFALTYRRWGFDVCHGHAGGPQSVYHHHNYSPCLRQQLNDEGTGHSPIYGYAGDGYPIHGPYHANQSLSYSCWKTRDYSANSETGCGTDGERSCVLVDEYDVSQGTTAAASNGPSTTDLVLITGFAERVTASSGFYYEDYYYDATCTAQGDAYLDQHNGHSHGDYGYHYHTSVDDNMEPTFPMVHGPLYYGSTASTDSYSCSGEGAQAATINEVSEHGWVDAP